MKVKIMIKKAYKDIVDYLNENQHASVSEVLPKIIEMASAKVNRAVGGASFLKDAENNVVAVNCYYFKRWMPVVGDDAVEFGQKSSTSTGLNTMSKIGSSNWTKQLREFKKAGVDLFAQVKAGEISVDEIANAEAIIETNRTAIVETELGFATKEELVAYLTEIGVNL